MKILVRTPGCQIPEEITNCYFLGKLVLKKWTYVRDSWMKSLKKHKEQKRSGTCSKPSRLYVFNDQMSFLKKVTDSAVPHESIHTDKEEDVNEEAGTKVTASTKQDVTETHEPSSVPSTSTTRRKRCELDAKMMRFIDHQMTLSKVQKNNEDESRHLTFFKSLLPSLSLLDEDETLEFQTNVLNLLQNIRAKKRRRVDSQMPSRNLVNYYNSWQDQSYYPQQQTQTVETPLSSPYNVSEPSPSTQTASSLGSVMDLDISDF